MQNKINFTGKQVVVLFGSVVALVLLILIGVSIYQIVRPNPYGEAVAIEGLSAVGMSRDAEERISANLYTTLEARVDSDDVEIPHSGAKVREGSIEKSFDEENKVNAADFIVDIESIQRSYRVHVEWGNERQISGYPFVISCLRDGDEIIYPDFYCVDDFDEVTDSGLVNAYLPYWGKTESGYDFMVRSKKYSDGAEYFEVSVDSCGEQRIMEEALSEAKKWINSLGVNAEAFKYEVPDYLCEGGAE